MMASDGTAKIYETNQPYVSCIHLYGRPILPPLILDSQRAALRDLQEQAVRIEKQLKEKKRQHLLKRLQFDFNGRVGSSVKEHASFVGEISKKNAAEGKRAQSLPTTPEFNGNIEDLHQKFLRMKSEAKDVISSDVSVTSTDLGPYMQGTGATELDTCCSETTETTAGVLSDTETAISLECSTPVRAQERIRRLSYTLEAPSPVLLKQMQQSHQTLSSDLAAEPSKLIFSIADSLNPQSNGPSKQPAAGTTPPVVVQHHETNGFFNLPKIDLPKTDATHPQPCAQMFGEFLQSQQRLMQELLDQQAREQERLAALFKEQEKQLLLQLQLQQSTSARRKSPACRNLKNNFDAQSFTKFAKLPALVRGYLTRRLMATDRVRDLIKTIDDTRTCLRELNRGNMTILPSDIELHRRLVQQLAGAVQAFHQVFFGISVAQRMDIISRDRQKKELSVNGHSVKMRPRSRSLSSATVKSLERKQLSRRDSGPTPSHSPPPPSSSSSTQRERRPRPWSASSFTSTTSSSTVTQSNGPVTRKKNPNDKGRRPWRC